MMSNLILYIVTVLVWGSTWIGIEYQLGVVDPTVSVFYRYVIAALVLFAWCGYRGLTLSFSLKAHLRFILLGTFLFGLNYILTYQAQVHITSAMSAIVFSTMLWMNMINSRIFFGVRSGVQTIVGSVLGVSGIAVLFIPQVGSLSLTDATLYGASLCILGAFIASLGNMVSQGAQHVGLPVIQSNAWGMFYGALITGIITAIRGAEFAFDWSVAYVGSLMYLALFGSIVAFGAYLTLLGRIGASKAGYAMVMFPVVALIISYFFEGLELNWNVVCGVALVIVGNIVILLKGRSKRLPGISELVTSAESKA